MKTVTETGMVPAEVELRFAPASLAVRHSIAVKAGRRRVFDALLHAGAWWPHRVRPGTDMTFEARVGGRFFENCDDGYGLLLGHVVRLMPPEEFAVEGSFGFDGPVAAVWDVRLVADGHERTALHGRFRAFGAIDDDARDSAPARWAATYAALAHYLDA